MKKTAILQCADSGPLESLVMMLRSVGYSCGIPGDPLKRVLRNLGCDTVLDIDGLVRGMGYEKPFFLPEVGIADMHSNIAIYVDVKGHRNCPRVVDHWPNLRGKVAWYRINGGKPEHVVKLLDGGGTIDHGDEMNIPCPIITPNQWYKTVGPWSDKAYTCWPPFYRYNEYFPIYGRAEAYRSPVCLIHNLQGWGYRDIVSGIREMGVVCYGAGSPDGLVNHSVIPQMLSRALAMVHLKSNDAPGYAIYEALSAACPIICTRRLIWRCKMQDLLIPGETCLVFDRETHDGLTPEDVKECLREVKEHLDTLRDPVENRRIGMNGRERLKQVAWNESEDKESLREFMSKHFG